MIRQKCFIMHMRSYIERLRHMFPRKIFFAAICFACVFFNSSEAFCHAKGMTINLETFITRLGYVYQQVPIGFSSADIRSGMHKMGDLEYMLEYNNDVMLLINAENKINIKNIAVTCILKEDHAPLTAEATEEPGNDTVFESICRQVIFALDKSVTDSGAKEILTSIGLFGPVLDGIQRSYKIHGLDYIMKLQANGMLVMVASPVQKF